MNATPASVTRRRHGPAARLLYRTQVGHQYCLGWEAHTLVFLVPQGARPKQAAQFREGGPLLQHYMLSAAAGSADVAASDNRICRLGRAAPSWRLPRPDQTKTLENCYEVDRK